MGFDHKDPNESGHLQSQLVIPRFNLQEATKFCYFADLMDSIRDLDGDIVECGVGWGWSFLYFCLLARIENRGRHLWAFDSFEGFPQPSEEDASPRDPQPGEWKTDLLAVYKLLESSGLDNVFTRYQVTLVKGFFEDSLSQYTGEKIALLHADADLYQSYKSIYEHLFDKVVPGGVILFDEYMNTFEYHKWPGAKKAIDETFLMQAELKRHEKSGKYYAIKK
jgi:O-methyltransferase